MLKLVSTNSNAREFRTTSRSDLHCGCRYRSSRPKKVAVRSAVSSHPSTGRSSTASRRYNTRTNNRSAKHTPMGRIQSAFDWIRPHSNVVRVTSSASSQAVGVIRHLRVAPRRVAGTAPFLWQEAAKMGLSPFYPPR